MKLQYKAISIFTFVLCVILSGRECYSKIVNKGTVDALGVSGFQLDGIASPGVSPSGKANIYFDSTANTLQVSQNGAAFTGITEQPFYQASAQTNSTNTLADSNTFTTSLEASTRYEYQTYIDFTVVSTAGMQYTWAGTVTVNNFQSWCIIYNEPNDTLILTDHKTTIGSAATSTAAMAASDSPMFCWGAIETNAAGTFKFQFSRQSGAGAGSTSVARGSYMLLRKIG